MIDNGNGHGTGLAELRDAIRPTIFIGLGSTGAKIVSRLKGLINSEADSNLANEFLSYFIITSEVTPETGVDRNIGSYVFSTQGLTGRAAVETFTKHRGVNKEQVRETFRQWWSFDENGEPWIPPVNDAGVGAGGIRGLGRLLLHMRCMDIELVDRIRQEVEAIRNKKENLDPHLRHLVDEGSISVYVFGLLAGGTCSGSVSDIALLIRTALPKAMIHGVFMLGDICYSGANAHEIDPRKVGAQKRNTAHALAEMALLQTEHGRQIALRNWVRYVGRCRIPEDAFDTKPFFKIALIGAANDNGYKLQNFTDYVEFVARFHALIYTTGTYREQMARAVDEQSQNVTSWDTDYPSRPNNFVRLGLMNIEIPKDRILALVRHKIAETLAFESFKDVDQARCEASKSRFFNEIHWSRLDSDFLPEARSFVPDLESRPTGAAEFAEVWEAAKADADRYLEGWYDPDSLQAKEKIDAFTTRLNQALENVIDDFLGQAEDRPVSFGSLESLLTMLVEAVNDQLATNAAQREELEEALFAQGGLNSQFDSTLAANIQGYPSRLKRMMMGRFTGNDELADLLETYQKKGRAYCGFVMLDRALMFFRSRLLSLSVVRRLITGDDCVRRFFAVVQQERNEAFRDGQGQFGIKQGVLEKMADLESVFVDPLLNGRMGPDSDLMRRDAAQNYILQNWRGPGQKTLVESFRSLVADLSPDPNGTRTLTFDQALSEGRIMDQLEDLVGGLRTAFQAAEKRIFKPAIEESSVWDGIRRYLRMQRGDPDATLKGLFSGYADRAAFFPLLSGRSRSDSFEPARYNYCICRMDDAQLAFERLNLPHPETYLDTLFTHAFGYSPRAVSQSDSSSFALSILRMIEGELPTNYEGYEELSRLMRLDSVEKVEESRRKKSWSDWRFPDWIMEWHNRGGAEFLLHE